MAKHHVVLHMVLLLYSTTLAKKLTPVENEVLGPTLAGPKNPLELTFERNASLVGMALSYMLCGYGTEITMEVTHYDNGEQVCVVDDLCICLQEFQNWLLLLCTLVLRTLVLSFLFCLRLPPERPYALRIELPSLSLPFPPTAVGFPPPTVG